VYGYSVRDLYMLAKSSNRLYRGHAKTDAGTGDKKEMGSGGEELEKVFEGCTDPCSLIVNI